MNVFYILAFVVAIITFAMTSRLGMGTRIIFASLVFVIPVILITLWVYKVGDKPLSDSVIVSPQDAEAVKKEQ